MFLNWVPSIAFAIFIGQCASASFPLSSVALVQTAQKACNILNTSYDELVAFPDSIQYEADINHWTVASEQNSTCSIEPRNANDITVILQLLGNLRVPFAVQSGGHAYNFNASSTPGVQINMARFNTVEVNTPENTVTLGTGLTWDQVYQKLEPLGIVVAGGRVPGIGVGGLTLGGGYSWKTNQVGLTIDTIVSYDLVLPTGKQVHVTNTSYPDLFFALKGGFNNYGVVYAITYEAQPLGLVFGGSIIYNQSVLDAVNNATAIFDLTNEDPKAQAIISYLFAVNETLSQVVMLYDGPSAPPGVFDGFLAIPSISSDVKTRTFVDFLFSSYPNNANPFVTGPFGNSQHTAPIVHYPLPLLEAMVEIISSFGSAIAESLAPIPVFVGTSAEPFLNPFSHSRGGAYPHPPSRQVTPAPVFIVFPSVPGSFNESIQTFLQQKTKDIAHAIQQRAVQLGQSRWDDLLYPNYALANTPLQLMYGSNVPKLNAIAQKYDPNSVMHLAGGFKFGG